MHELLSEFKKRKEFLICVDSDGCAMDTMVKKHTECFAPMAVSVWELQSIESKFLKTWNMVNLYTQTRGINRFKGLVNTFDSLEKEGTEMPDISSVRKWTETSDELSNRALIKVIQQTKDIQLHNTLLWSREVNKAIIELAGNDKPFSKVKESLAQIDRFADIAIVSSANSSAVKDEWNRHGLAEYVQVLCGQESGTKAFCIQTLHKQYPAGKLLMVGDAPGDLTAAQKGNALFYPIIVNQEEFSWTRLITEALPKFKNGTYSGEYQNCLIKEFKSSLDNQ